MSDAKETIRVAKLTILRILGQDYVGVVMKFVGSEYIRYKYYKTSIGTDIWIPIRELTGCVVRRVFCYKLDNHGEPWWTPDPYFKSPTIFRNMSGQTCKFETCDPFDEKHHIYNGMAVYINGMGGDTGNLVFGDITATPHIRRIGISMYTHDDEIYLVNNSDEISYRYDKLENTLVSIPYKKWHVFVPQMCMHDHVIDLKHAGRSCRITFHRGDADEVTIHVMKDGKTHISTKIALEKNKIFPKSERTDWTCIYSNEYLVQINRVDVRYITIDIRHIIDQMLAQLDKPKSK